MDLDIIQFTVVVALCLGQSKRTAYILEKSEGAGFTVTLGAGSVLLLERMTKLDSFWVDGVILG